MHRAVNKFVGLILGAAGTIILIVLELFGLLKWLLIGVMIPVSIVLGFSGFMIVMHPNKFFNQPWESIPNTKKRALMSLMLFSGMIFLLAISFLMAMGTITVSGE